MHTIRLTHPPETRHEDAAALLRALPDWFGIESSIVEYEHVIAKNPTVLATVDGTLTGFLTLTCPFPHSAEVHVMAVHPDHHGAGVGTRMLELAEQWLVARGTRFLQVKTLSATSPDPNYARTRRFYERCGFTPLEEFPTLWDPHNPCLQYIKAL